MLDAALPIEAALNKAALDGIIPDGAISDRTALEETVPNGAMSDKAELEETVPDGILLDRTAMDDIASYNSSTDSMLLHWNGISLDVSRDIPEGVAGHIIIKFLNEDGSVCYSGWSIEHTEDEKVDGLIESRITINKEGNVARNLIYVVDGNSSAEPGSGRTVMELK